MKHLLSVVLLTTCLVPAFGQNKSKASYKISDNKGALWFHWGYNRSIYTLSDMHFVGQGYDFTMENVSASDNPSKVGWHYLDPKLITVPQFSCRVGYNLKNNWAISFGYDHMKYIFRDNNHVILSGYIEPGLDQASNLSGYYENYEYTTDRTKFHYENSDGLNYLRAEISHYKNVYRTKSGWFGLTGSLGLSAGAILSFNDLRFAGLDTRRTISLSGYGISAHLGARFEFFRHVYLQANYGGGFLHQIAVKNRPNDPTAKTSQKFGYMEMNVVLGGIIYLKSKNNCGTCPTW